MTLPDSVFDWNPTILLDIVSDILDAAYRRGIQSPSILQGGVLGLQNVEIVKSSDESKPESVCVLTPRIYAYALVSTLLN